MEGSGRPACRTRPDAESGLQDARHSQQEANGTHATPLTDAFYSTAGP